MTKNYYIYKLINAISVKNKSIRLLFFIILLILFYLCLKSFRELEKQNKNFDRKTVYEKNTVVNNFFIICYY